MSSVARPSMRCAGEARSRPAVFTIAHSARRVVVLPAPLAPSSAVIEPFSHGEVDAVQHPRLPVGARAAPRHFKQCQGRPCISSGCARTSAGVPSAICRPKLSATTRSEMRITRLMWCSTSSTVSAKRLAQLADQRAELRRPPRGSGRSPARRAAAASARRRARAPARRASACRTAGRPPASSATRLEAEQREQRVRLVARRARPRARARGRRSALARKPPRVRQCAPTITLSSTLMLRNSARFWKVRPMPSAAMRWRGIGSSGCAVEHGSSPRSQSYRRDRQLNSVVLPAPFGPISPTMLPGRDVERDAVERDDAAEAHPDLLHAQQCLSGHDCLPRQTAGQCTS